MRRTLLSIALLLPLIAAAPKPAKAPPSSAPTSKPASNPSQPADDGNFTPAFGDVERNAKGERIWRLTRFLQGTTDDVRNALNHEVELFLARQKQLKQRIEEMTDARKEADAKIVETLRKSPQYIAKKADVDQAEKDMQAAQKSGSTQEKMDASSRFNRGRQELQQMETAALRGSEKDRRDKEQLKQLKSDLAGMASALTKAQSWRNELLDAMRFSFQIPGPVHVGDVGLIGKVTPLKIYDAQSVCVRFDANQVEGRADGQRDPDGIKSVNIRVLPTTVILSGINTSTMHENQEITIDKVFEITDVQDSKEFGETYYAKKTPPHDLDKLFEACETIRDVDPNGK